MCWAICVRAVAARKSHLRFSDANAAAMKARVFDLPAIRGEGFGYERLDQLTIELLLGVR